MLALANIALLLLAASARSSITPRVRVATPPFVVTAGQHTSENEAFAASQLTELLGGLVADDERAGRSGPQDAGNGALSAGVGPVRVLVGAVAAKGVGVHAGNGALSAKLGPVRVLVGAVAARKAGVPASALQGLGDEGYIIATSRTVATLLPRTVVVSGGKGSERGTMYAAFGLLRSLGFRFLAPDETVVPTESAAVAAATGGGLDARVMPRLIWRSHESYETDGANPKEDPPTGTAERQALNFLWTARVRNNGLGEHIEGGGFPSWVGPSAHTSYTLLGAPQSARAPPKDLWNTHREWFWPRDDPSTYGQLCWANASLVARVASNVLEMLRGNPNATMVSVSINDNGHACNDTTERVVVAAEGSESGPIVRAVNSVAKAVAAEFPRAFVHTLAYDYTRVAPRVTRPARNVVVQVASSGVGDPDIAAWGAASTGGGLFVWDYVVNYKHAVQPFPNYFALGPRYRWYFDHGVSGIYSEGFGHGPGSDMDALKAFVIESMMWDAHQDPDKLINEFLGGYYGAAAPHVFKYMRTMQLALDNVTGGYNLSTRAEPTAPFLTAEALLSSAALLSRAKAAVSTIPRQEQRVETIQLAVYYPILLRWTEIRSEANNRGLPWTVEPTVDAALARFLRIATKQNVSRLMEPDPNDFESPHNLTWFAAQVRCNCSWDLKCCKNQRCCNNAAAHGAPEQKRVNQAPSGLTRLGRAAEPWLDGCPGGPQSKTTSLLFRSLNLSFVGLEAVRDAVASGNLTAACNAVAQHYANAPTAAWLRKAAPRPGVTLDGGDIDAVVFNDTYNCYGEVGRVPRNRDGGLDWYYQGPLGDDEFMHALNRHFVWPQLLDAWQQTGNPVYARAFDALAADWTGHSLPAPNVKSLGNTTWHTLDVGIRAGQTWPAAFFGFQNAAELRASTRCAVVAALAEHGRYLNLYASTGNSNWRSMQYNGLGMVALTLPELAHASDWFATAEAQIVADMESGVYPDGVEDEETSTYHKVALTNFEAQQAAVAASGRTPDPRMSAVIDRMYNYLAFSLDAAGVAPLNGDADTEYNTAFVAAAAAARNRTDWAYVASHGTNGTRPDGPPSTMFPWGGQLVSRSGWGPSAQWSWFDVGPFGSSSHGHRDKLHLSVRVGAAHLLCDSGRFAYAGANARFRTDYGVLSSAHNVLLVDGRQQVDVPPKASSPLSNAAWSIAPDEDRARGSITFDGAAGEVTHTRSVVYARGRFWVVVDRLKSDRRRLVEALWHAHPNCTVAVGAGGVVSVVDNATRAGVDVVPAVGGDAVSGPPWNPTSIVRGQTSPTLQGWYSPRYDVAVPSPTAVFTASTPVGASTFAWLLVPTAGGAPSGASARVDSANATHVVVAVDVGGAASTWTVAV